MKLNRQPHSELTKMEKPRELPKSRASFLLLFFIIFLFFAIKAAILLHNGKQYGRLALPPTYDDVVYFLDGINRLTIYMKSGLSGVLFDLFNSPPHSPYATFASFLAFALAGPNRNAPYFINAVAAALLISWLIKKIEGSLSLAALIALVLISLPWFDYLITTFHPDFLAGLGAAIVAVIIIWQHQTVGTRLDAFGVGIVAGLVLLIKPPAMIMLAILWTAAGVSASICQLEAERVGPYQLTGEIWQKLGFALLGVALTAGWYLIPEFPKMLQYIYIPLVESSSAWTCKISIADHFFYYIRYSWLLFGFWLPAVPLILLFSPLVTTDSKERRKLLIRLFFLISLFLVSYIVPSITPVKSIYFGSVIYGFIIVCIVISFIQVNDLIIKRVLIKQYFGKITFKSSKRLIFLALSISILFLIKDHQPRYTQTYMNNQRVLFDQVFSICKNKTSFSNNDVILFWPTILPLGPHAFEFRGKIEGVKIKLPSCCYQPANSPIYQTSLEKLKEDAIDSDIIIIPDYKLALNHESFPVTRIIQAFGNWLSTNGQFQLVAEVYLRPTPEENNVGGKIFIFTNNCRPPTPVDHTINFD